MNLSKFLPKFEMSKDVFGTVYDVIIGGDSPSRVRVSEGKAWLKNGDVYEEIQDPVNWMLKRVPSLPGMAINTVTKLVPQFSPLVIEYLRRFCEGGGRAIIDLPGKDGSGARLVYSIGENTYTIENEEIRDAFSKYMFENQKQY